MDNNEPTNWQYSRFLAGKIYYEWIRKKGLIELLLRPETIPSLFYQKKWDEATQDLVEGILRFLASLSILQEGGGTYTMHDNYSSKVQQLELNLKESNDDHPSLQFINYGLKLLDSKLEGDAGFWDVVNKNFLLEIGFTQSAFEDFYDVDKHLENVDWKFKPIEQPRILIFANFVSNMVYSLVADTGKKRDITILTHDRTHKDQVITFCELNRKTSLLSNRVFALEDFENDEKFDLIIVPNYLGFNTSINDQLKLLQTHSTHDTILYLYAPTEAQYGIGIEPIYNLHPNYKGIPNTREFGRQSKAVGWSNDLRIGPNHEILLLKQG